MEWNEKLQIIIDYVENHLQRKEEPVNTAEIAQIAECSYSFFQKVFSYMNGISFADYVRARKLTLAGYDLKSTNLKVVDISFKYGYDSPTSFTKAFQQFHGVSPKDARNRSTILKVYPKMQIFDKQQYSWRIERKASFRLVFKSTVICCRGDSKYSAIPSFWNDCQRDGSFAQLMSIDTGRPNGLFGMSGEPDSETGNMAYSIGAESVCELPEGFRELIIPENAWAVFDCTGPIPQAIQNGWKYLTQEWLSKYPFSHALCPEFEWYSSGNPYADDYLSQIWIPIVEEEK